MALTTRARRLIAAAIGALTLLMGATGAAALHAYMSQPGSTADTPTHWPSDPGVVRSRGWTIVLAAHPECPCTPASIDELATAVRARAGVELIALARTPHRAAAVPDTPSLQKLRRLSQEADVRIVPDPGGDTAAAFGALTSGHTVVYGPDGTLAFSGGVTPSRGMRGPNTGRAVITRLLEGQPPRASTAPVFGCPLCGPASPAANAAEETDR